MRISPAFVGRTAERAAARERVSAVLDGRPSLVWIEGDAGAGKTALAEAVLGELPAAFRVLRAEGDELDVEEPFAVLGQLGVHAPTGPLAAGLALVDSWADGPSAVLVEDLHWADADSRAALRTAVRRLSDERVLVLVTSRPGPDDGWVRLSLDPRRCLRLDVGALDVADVAAMAAAAGAVLPERAAQRLHAHTAGHALHVRALLAELDPHQLVLDDGPLPAPRSLAATTIATLAGLPPAARDLALALAVLGRPVPLATAAHVAGVDRAEPALDALLGSALVTRRRDPAGELVAFAHPVFRVAVEDEISATRRRELHLAAAAALDPVEALGHRLAAADGPDAALAADLAREAGRSRERGALAVAARHLLGAARVSPGPAERADRLLDGVRLLLSAGRSAAARARHDEVEACADSPARDLVLGMLDHETGDAGAAQRWWRRAAAAPGPPEVVADAALRLAESLRTAGQGDEAVALAERVLGEDDVPADLARRAWIELAVGEQMRSGAVAGLERLAPRVPDAADLDPADTDLLVVRGTLHFFAARPTAAVADLEAALRLARRAPDGAVEQLPRAHLQLANSLLLTGRFDDAARHARAALGLIEGEGRVWVLAQAHAVLARLAGCVRGDGEAAREHLRTAEEAAGALASLEGWFTVLIARAMVADAADRPEEVLEVFGGLLTAAVPVPMSTSLAWWPLVVDAALDAGRTDDAEALLHRLATAATERRIDMDAVVRGLQGRVAQARGDVTAALAAYEEAGARLGPDDVVFDRGKLLHRHGALLLATGRRRAGLDTLRRALAVVTGARPYEQRIRRDLAVGNEPVPDRGTGPALTGRERDVAALVARGLTNRQTAAELYVSDKAVEYHLGHVYAKLGIRSRRELAARWTTAH